MNSFDVINDVDVYDNVVVADVVDSVVVDDVVNVIVVVVSEGARRDRTGHWVLEGALKANMNGRG